MRYYITKDGADVMVNPNQIAFITLNQEPNGPGWIATMFVVGIALPVILRQPNLPTLRAYIVEGERF